MVVGAHKNWKRRKYFKNWGFVTRPWGLGNRRIAVFVISTDGISAEC